LLRDVRRVHAELAERRQQMFATAAQCLAAAAEAKSATTEVDVRVLAKQHGVEPELLSAWLDYLGIGTSGPVQLGTPLTRKMEGSAGYDFIRGWVGDDALSVVANSSDQHVRIPGNMAPHSVAVHPSPTLAAVAGWRSTIAGNVKIGGHVQHAHPECGNGIAWVVELRRGTTRRTLAAGNSAGATVIPIGPVENVVVRPGDVVSLSIQPKDGNHSCDLTAIELTVDDGKQSWSLARDVSSDILAANPHADAQGNAGVWHFYSEPVSTTSGNVIPAGSALARWQAAATPQEQQQAAAEVQQLLAAGIAGKPQDSPEVALYRQLESLSGPLMTAALALIANRPADGKTVGDSSIGVDADRFGKHPNGGAVEAASLCTQAPSHLEIRLPASLLAGAEFVTAASLETATGRLGSVQALASTAGPVSPLTTASAPTLAQGGTPTRARLEASLDTFRQLFPASLCYTKIVPVDEVVTLTLFYREDGLLRQLVLDPQQTATLDRLWDELLYIAQEPLESVIAFTQISEFATQDRPDLVTEFAPLRQPILDRAEAYRQRLIANEPAQLDAVIRFAGQAYRRPLAASEERHLRDLYANLRQQEIPHDEAIRLTLARVLVSPDFLYRAEKPSDDAKPMPVNDWELASRLSYFLWSSQPDDELRQLAAAGKLRDPEMVVAQAYRMLQDPKARRLATEFACHWLHIHDFDQLNEKSERHFPTFAGLRGAMYEESIQFFTDLFQHNRSELNMIEADYTFLNEDLARHYGIPNVTGPDFRRVDGVKKFSRGGILTQATTLAKQSGASRTSPILRGNWLSEVVLGEKLPKPPKNVPPLAETAPEGLTERQLTERHSTEESCAKCHMRIDPFGYALEGFDAIGRHREKDQAGLTINTHTKLPDGTAVTGVADLQQYLLTTRRAAFLRQFNKKLLGYALGRAVQLSDEPLLTEIAERLASHDFQVGIAVETIVRSRQFRDIAGRTVSHDE